MLGSRGTRESIAGDGALGTEERKLRIVTLVLAAALGCGAAAVMAQEPAPLLPPAGVPAAPETRWSFKRVDDGFVRLDNKTGQVAHCTPVHPGWTCQAVSENQSAQEKQIERLQDEVASLKKEIADLKAAPPPPPPPPPPPEKGGNVTIRMPTGQEIARARAYLADTLTASWHQLVQMIMHFQHDVLRNG